jgi:nitrogen fixation NifU-like protein
MGKKRGHGPGFKTLGNGMTEKEQNQEGPAENGGEERSESAEERPSARVLRHAMMPEHEGVIEKPDAHAVIQGTCGDTDEFFLKIFMSRIQEVRFRTTGCFFTVAACDAVATLAEGKMVREAMRIGQDAVIEYLGGLPEDHRHCALLAAGTLYQALRGYIIRGRGL